MLHTKTAKAVWRRLEALKRGCRDGVSLDSMDEPLREQILRSYVAPNPLDQYLFDAASYFFGDILIHEPKKSVQALVLFLEGKSGREIAAALRLSRNRVAELLSMTLANGLSVLRAVVKLRALDLQKMAEGSKQNCVWSDNLDGYEPGRDTFGEDRDDASATRH
jgi:biotin operon repressor